MAAAAITQDYLLDKVWREPDLSYLLHPGQVELRDAFRSASSRLWAGRIARRFGKSFWACVDAVEYALGTPAAAIKYAAPTAKMVRTIVAPHMRTILADCPADIRPRHYRQEGIWVFPNGSEIHVAGCDAGGADRLRGTSLDRGYVDEAGFIDDLRYVLEDVLLPQTLTTGGRIAVISTPATTPAHDFTRVCAEAAVRGELMVRTVYQAPHIDRAAADELIAEYGGITSARARREYMAEEVVDDEAAIVPEFHAHETAILDVPPMPTHRDCYVIGDLGYVDLSFFIFGYYDFREARFVVEDELVFTNASTSDIVPVVQAKERELWGERHRVDRFLDAEPQVLAEYSKQGYRSAACRRDNLEAAVNDLRVQTARHQYAIRPECEKLRAHLRYGVWNKARTGFDRLEGYGHFDGVAALMYAVRHVSRKRNPYPPHGGAKPSTHWIPPTPPTEQDKALAGLMKPARRTRR